MSCAYDKIAYQFLSSSTGQTSFKMGHYCVQIGLRDLAYFYHAS